MLLPLKTETSGPEFLASKNGTIPFYCWPAPHAKSAVIFIHGLKSHAGWFSETSRKFTDKNIQVYAYDRSGSGRSELTRGDVKNYQVWIDEINAVIKKVRQEMPDTKIHLIGHCFGARLAMGAALQNSDEIASIILMSPPQLALKSDLTFPEKIKVLAGLRINPDWRVNVPIRDEMFTSNKEKILFVRNDTRRVKTITARFCGEILKLDRWILKNLKKLKTPTLVLLAARDQVVDCGKVKTNFFKRLECKTKEIETYDCEHHLFFEPEADRAIDRIVAWAEKTERRLS